MCPELPDILWNAQPQEQIVEKPAPQAAAAAAVELAPLSWCLLAIVVDCALIAATFLAAAMLVVVNTKNLPGPRAVELGAALACLAFGAAYQAFFFTFARATLGMRYAGIGLVPSTASIPAAHNAAGVEPEAGTLVVYAAKHGETALDGDGENSPFADAFVRRLQTPNIEIRRLFDLVRDDVMAATAKKQQPFSYGSLSGSEDFYFVRR